MQLSSIFRKHRYGLPLAALTGIVAWLFIFEAGCSPLGVYGIAQYCGGTVAELAARGQYLYPFGKWGFGWQGYYFHMIEYIAISLVLWFVTRTVLMMVWLRRSTTAMQQ